MRKIENPQERILDRAKIPEGVRFAAALYQPRRSRIRSRGPATRKIPEGVRFAAALYQPRRSRIRSRGPATRKIPEGVRFAAATAALERAASKLSRVSGPRAIAVDAMGGDRAPDEIVAGALDAAADGVEVVLFGSAGIDTGGLELVETSEVIEMHEKPADAVRAKPDSSLVAAHVAVAEGRAGAVLSAGNTGAMLAAGLLHLRRIPGVQRPAIAVPIPTQRGPSVLLDSGANADNRPEHLLQFAYMGSIFAEEILGLERPEVRLLSIGEEPEKGNQLILEAHALLAASDLAFAGNAESRELLAGAADVVVCDGFTGNVALKLLEGTIKTVLDALRAEIAATTRGKLGGLLIRPAARRLRTRLDPDTYGGAYLLGLRGLSVIAHGNSSRTAIANAIRLAARGVDHDVVGRLAARLPERRTPASV